MFNVIVQCDETFSTFAIIQTSVRPVWNCFILSQICAQQLLRTLLYQNSFCSCQTVTLTYVCSYHVCDGVAHVITGHWVTLST